MNGFLVFGLFLVLLIESHAFKHSFSVKSARQRVSMQAIDEKSQKWMSGCATLLSFFLSMPLTAIAIGEDVTYKLVFFFCHYLRL